MNTKYKIFSLMILTAALAGCDSSSSVSPFSPGGGAGSGTNIVSQKNFLMLFDEPNPPVLTDDGADGGVEVAVTINAADRLNLATTGATVYLDVDWGTLSSNTCVIESTGNCVITWTSNASFDAPFFPTDELVTFTAWTIGEESFEDINGNGIFDDGDIFTNDTSGPFLDIDHDGVFTFGADKVLSPGNSNGQLTAANSLFDGPECSHSTLCSGSPSIFISDRATLSIREAP